MAEPPPHPSTSNCGADEFVAQVASKKPTRRRKSSIYGLVADDSTKRHFALLRNRLHALGEDLDVVLPALEHIFKHMCVWQLLWTSDVVFLNPTAYRAC